MRNLKKQPIYQPFETNVATLLALNPKPQTSPNPKPLKEMFQSTIALHPKSLKPFNKMLHIY